MTRWGLILLASYLALGLGGVGYRSAVRYAVLTTVVVISIVGLRLGGL